MWRRPRTSLRTRREGAVTNDPQQLLSIGSLRKIVAVFVLIELLLLLAAESIFLSSSVQKASEHLIRPAISAALHPANLAVEGLNPRVGEEVVAGLNKTGYFEQIQIIDDFGDEIARQTTHLPRSELARLVGTLLGVDIIQNFSIPLKTSNGRFGQLAVRANLSGFVLAELRFVALRASVIVFLSLMLTWLLSSYLIRRLEHSIQTLVAWTGSATSGAIAPMPEAGELRFREIYVLANRTNQAFEAQQKALRDLEFIHNDRSEMLRTFQGALTDMGIYSILLDGENKPVFSNADADKLAPLSPLIEKFLSSNESLFRCCVKLGLYVLDLNDRHEDAPPRGKVFRMQVSAEGRSWIIQENSSRGGYTLISITEVTDLREIERRSYHAEKLNALGRIVSGVAHEFNNMLSIINVGITEAREAKQLPEDVSQYLDVASRASDRAVSTIRQLQQLSRETSDDKSVVSLCNWGGSVNQFLTAITGPGVRVDCQVEPGLEILVDQSLFDAAIINLCKNSSDAMNGHGQIRIRIKAASDADIKAFDGLDPGGDYVTISVFDDGPGVPQNIASQIFDPFFSTKAKNVGTGLGLSTVYAFFTNAGGGIQYVAEQGRGAHFKMILPRAVPAEEVVQDGAPLVTAWHAMQGMRVFIVDAEVDLVKMYTTIFERYGAHVEVATSLHEAQEKLGSLAQVDLAILDHALKDGQGISLAPAIKARFDGAICLCLSGDIRTNQGDAPAIDRFVAKPISLQKLGQIIIECMAQKARETGSAA